MSEPKLSDVVEWHYAQYEQYGEIAANRMDAGKPECAERERQNGFKHLEWSKQIHADKATIKALQEEMARMRTNFDEYALADKRAIDKLQEEIKDLEQRLPVDTTNSMDGHW